MLRAPGGDPLTRDVVDRFKITQFYTSPTAIRALMKAGTKVFDQFNLSSLRVLGSVGEPINPEVGVHHTRRTRCAAYPLARADAPSQAIDRARRPATGTQAWRWYNDHVGRGRCAIVDTFWQTETGAIMISPLPGATPTKPGSASLPFFGVVPVILDPHSGVVLEGNNVSGVLGFARPWPSMARSVHGDHDRYMTTYLKPYPGALGSSSRARGCATAADSRPRCRRGRPMLAPRQASTLRATVLTATLTATIGSAGGWMVRTCVTGERGGGGGGRARRARTCPTERGPKGWSSRPLIRPWSAASMVVGIGTRRCHQRVGPPTGHGRD